MKVIHLISGGDSGGAKTHVLSLLQNLNQTITAQLVCFRDGPFAEEARSRGIPTEIMGGNNIPRLQRQLKAYIRAGGYQLIHCHGSRANMVGALLRRSTGLPVVSTIHSDYRLDYMGRPLSRLTFGTINAWALRHLDYRIGVSDAMVDLLISRGFPPDRFYAIYNGIDFTPPPAQGERLPYLRSLGVDADEDSVVVGIAARLNPVKDMATLVRGYAAACRTCPRLRLVIAGEGPEREKLGALAQELGVNVTFAGWISGGMDQFYSALDINALTSLSETFPYALTEGARFRLATVASAVGGIPDLIDSGVNGCLFQPGDWQTLGEHLAALGSNDTLRRQLGEKLYEKASSKFSIQKTVDTQLHIYQEILRRHSRLKTTRDGVVICGAYGRGNAGDDAILEAILQEMALIDPDMPATVLSKEPKSTRLAYRVRSVSRTNMFAWHSAMRHAKLYINGGGSLIQDVTSRRSLWFYLLNIAVAKRCGCKVQMYGCGIGPVTRENHRRLAARVLNRYVDVITLREPDSREELRAMGVTKPEILLTADPALTLRKAEDDQIDSVLLRAGIPPQGRYLCFALRQWRGFEEKAPLFGAAARYAYKTYGLIPVFTAVEKHLDPAAARLAAQGLDIPHYFLDDAGGAGTIIGALSRMEAVVSMRLHALIFAAGQGIPLAGVVYDPKVSAFLRYTGQDNFTNLEDLTEAALRAMIDRAVGQAGHPETQAAAVERLQAMEGGNVAVARRLLKL
ncbi:polysaccharide pyruvyl transferase CsaB [Dysosmobacter sp. NSJ-60]|mgnify:CR=1 FL=1|uniref:polysaccharide pyruvyl transferase CsaB n=1 Tax=Pusillibacter faecalis TaxID=2714358 RepID=UPI00164E0316|nr:polysaccharide pyruvyl transferase CsaB [Pusillibacter faecalis]MBC5748962.1 polysaccharide pyruvyl transferase CsaB [Dysosmobacter hominis]MBS5657530.1 polysaccharide pyruvyl transferase CsaB [Oscillibacter sp.]MCQ5027703.1 polysaccharide pyruvyl transferase CsaB [Oscillibacter valericigenes]